MASITRKRKAVNGMDDAAKKLRITDASAPIENIEEVSESDYKQEEGDDEDVFSRRNSHDVNTPNTPGSPAPGRKKFPSEYKTIKCTWAGCDKAFNRPARLTAHLRSHTNERPFVCTYVDCDKTYMDDKHLKLHIKAAHTKDREFQCDWEGCGKTFLTSTRRNRHRATHDGPGRFVCTEYSLCNQTFRKHETLERHVRSDHLQMAPYPCTYVDLITSVVCSAAFDGAAGLKKHHDREHTTPQFFCPSCFQPEMVDMNGHPIALAFTTNAKLQSHIRKEHAECLFCNIKFSSYRELEKHVETQHSGLSLEERKNVACAFPECNKTFTKQSNLNQHFSTAHANKRYICGEIDVSNVKDIGYWDPSDACGREFFAKANVEDHIRTAHLGLASKINVSRNKDQDTPVRQSKPSALQELAGTAYSGDERRTIPCLMPGCDRMFIRDYDLQNHVRRDHCMDTPTIEAIIESRAALQSYPPIVPDELSDLEARIMGEVEEMTKQYADVSGLTGIYGAPAVDWNSAPIPAAQPPFWFGGGM
ncbi:hypothetical protein BJ878DRAFT_538692 [Calycina marina]|uniref:C2H2-type domain-containing protein n=1 Tax=Calycina marina TaxID=1763456 RepID=A0A9P8CI82_9HELO|nr:hypothetical protein BJ878DRAFT_538692 [Calycina marina]